MMEVCVRSYRSKAADSVDAIAWKVYGRQDARLTEGIYDANPGLADHGPLLPAGLIIAIPDAPDPAPVQGVRLWG